MHQFTIPLTAIVLFVLVGCGEKETLPTLDTSSLPPEQTTTPLSEEPSSSPTSTNPTPVTNPSPTNNPMTHVPKSDQPREQPIISAKGIGSAQVGMTLGELKQVLGDQAEFQVKSAFLVDFDAIAIVQGGKEQYYILYPTGAPMRDTDIIEALVTDNPNYQTVEGIGPGTPLKKAEAVYGDATLSYNLANESREYVKFAEHPSQDIAFRMGAGNDGSLAGIYPSSQKELNETKQFKETARIRFVEVYCGQNCPLPPLP